MIEKIIRWSLQNRLFVIAGAAILFFWGSYQAANTPVDVFPDLTAPRVTVVAEAHGMAPREVETLVTLPIEAALNGAAGVRRVRSSTKIGLAVVTVEFDWGEDIYRARQIVNEKLQLASASLPAELPPPVLAPVTSIMGEILFVAITSDRHSLTGLRTVADWTVRRRLLAVPGVAEVIPYGGDIKQYQVIVRMERLAAYHVSLNDVVDAVKSSNRNSSAGFYNESGREYLIQGIGRVTRPEDIGNAVITMRGTEPIRVKDVADVRIGVAPKRGTAGHNASAAVVLGIQKQPVANTLELTKELDRVMTDIQSALPTGMKLETEVFRQADFISVSIQNLMAALRDGGILVILIVFGFLWSARATGITLLAIPLSLVVTILVMQAVGATINTMTLGGMAIALGALVDDAIIVVENIVRRLRENRGLIPDSRKAVTEVVLNATREIQGSIVFATLIIILVFLPLFFLGGVEGRLMQPLGLAYVVSLAASLLVAITVTPVLSNFFLKADDEEEDKELRWVAAMKSRYSDLLDKLLTRWKLITSAAVSLLVVSLVALVTAGQSFLPDFNEGSLTVSASTLPGTSLEESDRLGTMVEKILIGFPEVKSTARRTGRALLDPHAQDIHQSEMEVSLRKTERPKEELLEALRNQLASVPGMNIIIGQPISHRVDHMLSGTRANIALKLFGSDLYELRRLAKKVEAVMAGVKGVVDLSVEQQTDVPFLTVRFDRDALARFGMTIDSAADIVETAFYGQTVSRVLEQDTSFDLVVRYDPEKKNSFEAVRETLITTPTGAHVHLHSIADVRKDRGPNTISREDVQRKIVVMANVAGRDLVSVVDEIRQRVSTEVPLPAGYHVEYGGQFESAAAASETLGILGAIVIAGIFLLLYVAFHSARDALLIMLNLPLALIGGVIGLYLTGGVMSVATLIGFITLFGIATRNGVMLIAHIRNLVLVENIKDLNAAVKRGAIERLVPILMTALAAGLALVPLALSAGEPGSEIQAPMAVVILWGLISSTILNMIVVPALYLRFGALVKNS